MPPIGAILMAAASALATVVLPSVIAAVGSFLGVGAFLATVIGTLIVTAGLFLLNSLVNRPPGANMEAGKINVKMSEPVRWINAGKCRQGGGILFAEFDAAGNLWYLVVHSDSRFTGTPSYYFDETLLTLDGSGNVTNDDFCLNNKKEYYTSGTKVTYFQIWTATYTDANVTPPAISAFASTFPSWTTDHKLVGTTYSVIKVKALDIENRYKIYKHRGPLGLGEPAVSIVADWSEPYDPRTETYGYTTNTALIWAWFRTHPYGMGKSHDSIDWAAIATQADICDETVVGDAGSQPRYECHISAPENKERSIVEQEILITGDAQIIFNNEGKASCRVGYYEIPSLNLTRNRDIMAMESVEIQNGESVTQGVIVRYTDPEANYAVQPSAPWYNPDHYVSGEAATFLTVDALACQNHNQAMRLAKALGKRSQPLHKILPTVGLRGLKARQERIVEITYDNTFAGDYEIVTPVEVDQAGVFCGFGLVPVDSNRWSLLSGEEKAKPVINGSSATVTAAYVTVTSTEYIDGKIFLTYTPVDTGTVYEFEYIQTSEIGSGNWINMAVNTNSNTAVSGTVSQNISYSIRQRVRLYFSFSDWSTPYTFTTGLLTLSGTPVTTGTVGVAYAGFTVGVSGGTTPYIFYDYFGALPTGIYIDSYSGVVSGTPDTAGTYSDIVIRVMDNLGFYADLPTFTITVAP